LHHAAVDVFCSADYPVSGNPFDVANEADAATVVLEARVI
jgi:hypothetical protein